MKRRGRRCEPVRLEDGSVVFAMVRGELTDEDKKAISDFVSYLRVEKAVVDWEKPPNPKAEG